LAALLAATTQTSALQAQTPHTAEAVASRLDPLHELDASLRRLTEKVSPAIVEISVSGFGQVGQHAQTGSALYGKQHSLGSGVLLDPSGYIITNAHVIEGAQKIDVILPSSAASLDKAMRQQEPPRTYPARILGVDGQFDLALIKIDAKDLPYLTFADPKRVQQGELTLAIGSPEGLENSVTMGILSAVARQADPNKALVYLQTDAPINPGNSGGALIDADGHLLGINTFIFTNGGGSEGLGFAIPGPVVKYAYESFRSKGRIDRPEIGVFVQSITPQMAEALQLPRNWGVVVSDLDPEGMAAAAGVHVGDVITAIDGRPVNSMPLMANALISHAEDAPASVDILRGDKKLELMIAVSRHRNDLDKLAASQAESAIIDRMSVAVLTLDSNVAKLMPSLRLPYGVVVMARTMNGGGIDNALQAGDVIHAINRTAIHGVAELQTIIAQAKSGDTLVLQVERGGELQFVSCEVD
jgi:serine protease Do